MTIRVLIADDQALVRAGFRMIVEAQPDMEVVGEAGDGLEAAEAATRLTPDVVLMDIRMPRMDGIQATRKVVEGSSMSRPRVLILTTFDLDEYVFEGLRAGASGFLLKDVLPEELAHAVRVVAGGESLLAPSVTRRLIEEFTQRTARLPEAPPELGALTDRELEVLKLVARGLSNTEIAQSLYLSLATVKTHVGRVFMKLGLRDRAQAVVLAYEAGVVQPGDEIPGRSTAPTDQSPG